MQTRRWPVVLVWHIHSTAQSWINWAPTPNSTMRFWHGSERNGSYCPCSMGRLMRIDGVCSNNLFHRDVFHFILTRKSSCPPFHRDVFHFMPTRKSSSPRLQCVLPWAFQFPANVSFSMPLNGLKSAAQRCDNRKSFRCQQLDVCEPDWLLIFSRSSARACGK